MIEILFPISEEGKNMKQTRRKFLQMIGLGGSELCFKNV